MRVDVEQLTPSSYNRWHTDVTFSPRPPLAETGERRVTVAGDRQFGPETSAT